MSDSFDPQEMIKRFKQRAEAVRQRQVPPIEGEQRKAFIEQSKLDFMDFAMIADSECELDDGILTFKVDLRPKS